MRVDYVLIGYVFGFLDALPFASARVVCVKFCKNVVAIR
jgi:hypothetical protein